MEVIFIYQVNQFDVQGSNCALVFSFAAQYYLIAVYIKFSEQLTSISSATCVHAYD